MFLVVVIQEIVSTTPNRSGGNELQLITKMPMCNIEMGFFMIFSIFEGRKSKKVFQEETSQPLQPAITAERD